MVALQLALVGNAPAVGRPVFCISRGDKESRDVLFSLMHNIFTGHRHLYSFSHRSLLWTSSQSLMYLPCSFLADEQTREFPHSFRSTPINFIDGRLMVTDDWAAAAAEAFPSCVEEKATKPVSPTNAVSWCSATNLTIGCVNSPARRC